MDLRESNLASINSRRHSCIPGPFYLAATGKKNPRARGEASASKSGSQREFLFVVSFTYAVLRGNEAFNEKAPPQCVAHRF